MQTVRRRRTGGRRRPRGERCTAAQSRGGRPPWQCTPSPGAPPARPTACTASAASPAGRGGRATASATGGPPEPSPEPPTERERLLGSGSAVPADSEVGQLLLYGNVEEAMRKHLEGRSRGHVVHGSPDTATPQPQQDQEHGYDPSSDSEALERAYSSGPDWDAIRSRQGSKTPDRGPHPEE